MFDTYSLYQQPIWFILSLMVIMVWELVWKALALWQTARNKQKVWFVCILIFNTFGLLPIIYLLWFKPKVREPKSESKIEIEVDEKKLARRKRKKK